MPLGCHKADTPNLSAEAEVEATMRSQQGSMWSMQVEPMTATASAANVTVHVRQAGS